jgi:hypothetical protein
MSPRVGHEWPAPTTRDVCLCGDGNALQDGIVSRLRQAEAIADVERQRPVLLYADAVDESACQQ